MIKSSAFLGLHRLMGRTAAKDASKAGASTAGTIIKSSKKNDDDNDANDSNNNNNNNNSDNNNGNAGKKGIHRHKNLIEILQLLEDYGVGRNVQRKNWIPHGSYITITKVSGTAQKPKIYGIKNWTGRNSDAISKDEYELNGIYKRGVWWYSDSVGSTINNNNSGAEQKK